MGNIGVRQEYYFRGEEYINPMLKQYRMGIYKNIAQLLDTNTEDSIILGAVLWTELVARSRKKGRYPKTYLNSGRRFSYYWYEGGNIGHGNARKTGVPNHYIYVCKTLARGAKAIPVK
jgi:hypothetical protein